MSCPVLGSGLIGPLALVKRAKAFLDWLREADEEEESDDE
jgi:hypothetical protein